jgi:hypothetical protein
MAHQRVHIEPAMGRGAVQVEGDADDGEVDHQGGDQEVRPNRKTQETVEEYLQLIDLRFGY